MKISFPQDEPLAVVNMTTGEVKVDAEKPDSNVVPESEFALRRWAKRILDGNYKIEYRPSDSIEDERFRDGLRSLHEAIDRDAMKLFTAMAKSNELTDGK